MVTIDYAPQHITADQLDAAIELDTEFIVNPDGTVELSGNHAPEVTGHQGPEDPTIVNDPGRWEFFSSGYTAQWGYNGPEMHSSEYLGGRLARDILASPGTYAVVGVRYDCDPDTCPDPIDDVEYQCPDGPHIESWVVLKTLDANEEEQPS